ncbi:MAG: cupin domain-containing protein [Armatimonadetes bacterium]|nr:cupin domain-containing protein [Armatimonadota bacterium]
MAESILIKPEQVEITKLPGRYHRKLVEPSNTGSRQFTMGIMTMAPGGSCAPGHGHEDQEEFIYGLSGKGVVIVGDDRAELEMEPGDTVFIPVGEFHDVRNDGEEPFQALWVVSPPGWVFDTKDAIEKQYGKAE